MGSKRTKRLRGVKISHELNREKESPPQLPANSYPPISRLAPHQREAIMDYHRFKVLVWHRRARKTTTALYEMVRQALLRVGVYWYVNPTYGGAKDAVWRDPTMLFTIIPKEVIRKTNESELVVYLKNGSLIQLKGADNPELLRGANPMGIVLDEFATMKPDVWPIVEPILRANQGWAWFVGTPKGKNHLYEFYQEGLKGREEWGSFYLKASTSGIIHSSELAESRQTMAEDLYSQEFECAWLEGQGQVFRGVRDIADAEPQPPKENHIYVMGVDLAKVQDWTVLVVYDRANNKQVYIERFQSLEWPFQKMRIKKVFDHYNRPNMNIHCVAYVDATGIGDPIADDLAYAGVAVEPFKIQETSKRELIDKLRMYINQKIIRIIPTDETLMEFDNFSYKIGFTGKISYSAPDNYHDDCFISGTKILTPSGQKPIQSLRAGDMVVTRNGPRPIIYSRSSIKRTIEHPVGLIGTPNHPVITPRGQTPLGKLCDIDTIYMWNEKRSCIEERRITGIPVPPEDTSGFITGGTTNGRIPPLPFIGKYGLIHLAAFLGKWLSTTKMGIHLITVLRTWKSLIGKITPGVTCCDPKSEPPARPGPKNRAKDFICLLLNGKINNPAEKEPAWSAVQALYLRITCCVDFVARIARAAIGKEGNGRYSVVYNLQIFEAPEYFANGILVHNCVIAHALGVWSLNPIFHPAIIKPKTLIQAAYERAKNDNADSTGWGEWEQIE